MPLRQYCVHEYTDAEAILCTGYMPTGLMTSRQVNDELMSRRVLPITIPYFGILPDYTRHRSPLSSRFYTSALSLCSKLLFFDSIDILNYDSIFW